MLIVKSYFKAFLTASKENLFWPLVFLPHIICLIFFLRSDFSAWDMQGHLIAATKFKDSIFPFLSGWNSSHFAGYPQGYLYPSFFHWLIGGLGKITNIEFAFSFWVCVSVLLTPFSWFYFARNHGLDANKIKIAILFQTLLYFAPKNSMGGDVFGTYLIGLVNQQWAMPFFYFYLGSIVKLHERKNWVLSALFLGIICLSHAFVLFASIIATFAYLFASRDFLNFSRLKVWLKTIFLSLIIGAGWWLPYLNYREWGTGTGLPFFMSSQLWGDYRWGISILMGIFFLILSVIFFNIKIIKSSFNKYHHSGSANFIIFTLILILLLGAFNIIAPFPSFDYFPLHLYRLQFFLLSIFMFMLCFGNMNKSSTYVLVILTVCSCFYGIRFADLNKKVELNLDLKFNKNSRPLIYQGSEKFLNYQLPHKAADAFSLKKYPIMNGLFVESAKNSSFYMSLLFGLFKKHFAWGVKVPPFNSHLVQYQLDSLGITTLFSKAPLSDELRSILPITKSAENIHIPVVLNDKKLFEQFSIYSFNYSTVESLSHVNFIKDHWDNEIFHWWTSFTRINTTLIRVRGDNYPKPSIKDVNEKFFLNRSFFPDERFDVHVGERSKWIKIKESYFPLWKAFSNNKELPVYLCSPYMMCVYGEGLIQFKFMRGWVDYLGHFLTIFGFVFCFFSFSRMKASFFLLICFLFSSCHPLDEVRPEEFNQRPAYLSTGSYHSCILIGNDVYCSGYNNFSQLGRRTFKGTSKFIKAKTTISNPKGLSLGAFHTCVWDSKKIECVGDNFDQQFGFKSDKKYLTAFQSVHDYFEITNQDILDVQSFGSNICVLARDLRRKYFLHCSGRIWRDAGYKFRMTSDVPIESLALGEDHLCYVQSLQVFCSGSSQFGATTYINDLKGLFSPIQGIDDKNFHAIKVSAGAAHSCGIFFDLKKNKDTIFCWGDNSHFQVSPTRLPSPYVISQPREVEDLNVVSFSKISSLRTGHTQSCAIINERIFCWGSGILYGNPVIIKDQSPSVYLKEIFLGKVRDIFLGVNSSCALMENNFFCFGQQLL